MSIHRTIAEDEAEERHNQEVARLRASHDRLLEAAKEALRVIPLCEGVCADMLRAAIAAAEELSP
jgi:hypothetical protein